MVFRKMACPPALGHFMSIGTRPSTRAEGRPISWPSSLRVREGDHQETFAHLNILLVREDSERFLQHCEPPVMLAELRIGHDLVHPALGLKFTQFGSQVLPH